MSNNKRSQSLSVFCLEKPDLKDVDKSVVFEKLETIGELFNEFLREINEPKYLYWDKVKYKQPIGDLNIREVWFW